MPPKLRLGSSVLFLFALPTLIWGSTFLAIKFQLGVVSPEFSIFIRFVLATAISFAVCGLMKAKMKFPPKTHLILILTGIGNFSLNYILTYRSEEYLPSGLVAVTFTLLIYLNMFGVRIFYKKPISPAVFGGAFLGALGIVLLCWSEIQRTNFDHKILLGFLIGTLGTVAASAGNMFTLRLRQLKVPVLVGNSWGMFYGTLFSLICFFVFSKGGTLIDPRPTYWLSLIYLSIFGTVIAFWSYMTLMDKVGAERSAYTTVMSPVIALILSTYFENFHWDIPSSLGIVCCVTGNILVLRQKKPKGAP